MGRYCVAAHCAAGLQRDITAADLFDKRNENANVLAYMGRATGRFGAALETISYVSGPGAPAVRVVGSGVATAGWLIGGLEQVMRPNPYAYGMTTVIDLGVQTTGRAAPGGMMLFNEIGEYLKSKYAN